LTDSFLQYNYLALISLALASSFEEKKAMETLNNKIKSNRQFGMGIFLLVIGAIFLLRNIGLNIPFWVLSWHTLFLALGLLIGYRKNFKAGGWVFFVILGGVFTLKDLIFFDISQYTTAMVLIGVGLYMIFRPKRDVQFCDFGNKK